LVKDKYRQLASHGKPLEIYGGDENWKRPQLPWKNEKREDEDM